MNIIINKIKEELEENVVFNIYEITPFLESIINSLRNDLGSSYLIATDLHSNNKVKLFYYDIYYLEYVNRSVFIYTEKNVYEIKEPLYRLEKQLPSFFARCSKSMIVNTRRIKEFSSSLNGNIIARLLNEEKIVISRRYVKAIKNVLESIN
ncbi:LytTR family DNA-binding domain-containing protein [Clostridium baratii]|uniref:LytTR family DNA-binding domain-containing protein n=1 Tax=Clostridium baratii TaxID=1561 RepID=UPI002902DF10|nr:LytTR family DNA-binding domain-containing protein [Clostridium baratii]MDU1055421.1 LytTR family DNA-binding domain-containing protein [Clostridium baratii]